MTTDATSSAPAAWWESRWFAAALVLAACVPLLYPKIPPLVDLLGHMGRYRVQLDLAQSPELQRYFDFHWQLIGNLGVDLLIVPMSKLVGLEMAVKLIAIAIPPMTVAGFLWVAREVHGRLPPTAAFAVPFAFGYPFMFGFLNYTLSMALAMLAFGLWLRLGRLEKLRLRAALFVPISFIIFICHAFGWGTLGLLCFAAEAVRQHDKGASWWKAALRAVPHAAVMAGPILLMLLWRSDVSRNLTGDLFNMRVKAGMIISALRDRWQMMEIFGVIGIFILLIAIRSSPSFRYSRILGACALMLFAVFLLMPRYVFGSAYADMRIVAFMMALAALTIGMTPLASMRLKRNVAIGATVFALAFIGARTASLAMAANRHEMLFEALDRVPRGAALITLVGEGCDPDWAARRDTHVGGIATVRRHAFTNDQWAVEGANLLSVRFAEAGPFKADPSQMVHPNGCRLPVGWEVDKALRRIPRDAITHVWTVDLPPHDPAAFDGYRLAWTNGPSSLYVREVPAQ